MNSTQRGVSTGGHRNRAKEFADASPPMLHAAPIVTAAGATHSGADEGRTSAQSTTSPPALTPSLLPKIQAQLAAPFHQTTEPPPSPANLGLLTGHYAGSQSQAWVPHAPRIKRPLLQPLLDCRRLRKPKNRKISVAQAASQPLPTAPSPLLHEPPTRT